MISHEVVGDGPALLLIHGSQSSRRMWDPVLPQLSAERTCVLVDLPGFGDSPPGTRPVNPIGWTKALGDFLDAQGHDRIAICGLSMGGWMALELAKAGRATGVLSLVPAGLWGPKGSPRIVNARLNVSSFMGRTFGFAAPLATRSALLRRLTLGELSAAPAQVSPEHALTAARDSARSTDWPRHFADARTAHFSGGQDIDVPVHLVWGAQDRIAIPASRQSHELPAHTRIETWEDCGHMVTWDQPDRLVQAALSLPSR